MSRKILCLKYLLMFAALSLCLMYTIHLRNNNFPASVSLLDTSVEPETQSEVKRLKKTSMKYILQWTSPTLSPFVYMGRGQETFIAEKCPNINCYVTHDQNLLEDITAFDVIAFAGPEVRFMDAARLPQRRSPHQKYVFGTIESAHNYPMCNPIFDGFFNWTWTYKLDSDARWGYMTVRDLTGKVVAPKVDMHWIVDMKPIGQEMKSRLESKKKAAAWFVSNCHTISRRENFVNDVIKHLFKFGLTVDIYGPCGKLSCPRDKMDTCLKMLESDYYFYFAFENSFSEDYVTEKLLNALMSDTVPVVYGGANYTRFMPDGIYLDGRALGAEKLAQTMNDIIHDKERYYSFFKYKNHYSYGYKNSLPDTNDYCGFCDILYDEERVKNNTVYTSFRQWWNNKETKCDKSH